MMLGKLPVSERTTNLDKRPSAHAGCADGVFGHSLSLLSIISVLFPSLLGMARNRLKYGLKWTFGPKQPTNQRKVSDRQVDQNFNRLPRT